MGDGPSDWEKGILAAAAWLRDRTAKELGELPDSKAFRALGDELAQEMLRSLTPDPEGTEARVVGQIVQWLHEVAACAPARAEDGFDTIVAETTVKILRRIADDIRTFRWRRA